MPGGDDKLPEVVTHPASSEVSDLGSDRVTPEKATELSAVGRGKIEGRVGGGGGQVERPGAPRDAGVSGQVQVDEGEKKMRRRRKKKKKKKKNCQCTCKCSTETESLKCLEPEQVQEKILSEEDLVWNSVNEYNLALWYIDPDKGPEECLQNILWSRTKRDDGTYLQLRFPAFSDISVCSGKAKWKTFPGYSAHLRKAHRDLVFCVLGGKLYARRRRKGALAQDVCDGLTAVWLLKNVGPVSKHLAGSNQDRWDIFRWKMLSRQLDVIDPSQNLSWQLNSKPAVPVGELDQWIAITPAGTAQCSVCNVEMAQQRNIRQHLEERHFVDERRHSCRYSNYLIMQPCKKIFFAGTATFSPNPANI